MTMNEAAKIVTDCIRIAANFSGEIFPENTLDELGVNDSTSIASLKDCIVNVRVPALKHTLSINHLAALSKSWTVIELVVRVQTNAVKTAGNLRPAMDRAAEAIGRLGGGQ